MFYYENPWGIDIDEILDGDADVDQENNDGLQSLSINPPDSEKWTVSAVPQKEFLDSDKENNSSEDNNSEEFESDESDSEYYSNKYYR